MTGICWLASYPKSGNTWLRLLLQSCLAGGEAVDINAIALAGRRGKDRAQFDEDIGIASADLTEDEILAWRAAALRAWARAETPPVFFKTHEMRSPVAGIGSLFPADLTSGAIYLVRDPRDVALSLARHLDVSVDAAIAVMGTPGQRMERSRHRLRPQLFDHWGSWSENVEDWCAPRPFLAHIVRYEALRADPESALAGILVALALPVDPEAVQLAIAATTLDRLRAQEAEKGFAEWEGRAFFGDGRVQGWRHRLTPHQVARIEADHGPVMRRLGYLPAY
jgi:aryl sulfotransferase